MTTDLSGTLLNNNYFLREYIASGGMADVYKAWDIEKHTLMAIKLLRQDLAQNPKVKQMFEREAGILRKLEHPNIVRLYKFDQQKELAYIVMDWVDGQNLKQKIIKEKKTLSLDETSQVLGPVCNALGFAHSKGIYHCDVKPPNIMLHKNGVVLITDFGIAHSARERGQGGTPPYMAPEQFQDGVVDARTDVYSLGVTLYEVLSGGNVPFRGDSPQSQGGTTQERIAWEHINMKPPPLQLLNPSIPVAVCNVIQTALQKDPKQRYPSCAALRESFEHARLNYSKGNKQTNNTVLEVNSPIVKPTPPVSKPNASNLPVRKGKGPYLYCRSGDLAGQVIPIPASGLTLGRSRQAKVLLSEPSISRSHASILYGNRGVYIQDENSRLGTIVNNKPITSLVQLHEGDIVQIGFSQVFEFHKG